MQSKPKFTQLAESSMASAEELEELATNTNESIKQKYNSGMDPTEIESYIIGLMSARYAQLLHKNLRRGKNNLEIDPNEDLATMHEWLAIIGHHLLHKHVKVCGKDASLAHAYRERVKRARNGELYYPILAEYYKENNNLAEAIEMYKIAGDRHTKRLDELVKQRKEAIESLYQENSKAKAKVSKTTKKVNAKKNAR